MSKIFIPTIIVLVKFVALATAQDENEDGLFKVGDMLLTKEQLDLFSNSSITRNAITTDKYLWPGKLVNIRYYGADAAFRRRFEAAVSEIIKAAPCIKFSYYDDSNYPYPNDHLDVVHVHASPWTECLSTVGYTSFNRRSMTVDRNPKICGHGDILHQLMHVLGFFHMHNSGDRDDYVTMDWGNIRVVELNAFNQIPSGISRFGTVYDYTSITHGGPYIGSKEPSRLKTMTPKAPLSEKKYGDPARMGQRESLSPGDKVRLNSLYSCRK